MKASAELEFTRTKRHHHAERDGHIGSGTSFLALFRTIGASAMIGCESVMSFHLPPFI